MGLKPKRNTLAALEAAAEHLEMTENLRKSEELKMAKEGNNVHTHHDRGD